MPAHGSDFGLFIYAEVLGMRHVIFVKDEDGLYDKDPKRHGDAKLIKQAVLNLMLNAVRAMAETRSNGHSGGELILSASRRDGEGVIDVIDTGPGIAPDQQAHIFDRFWTGKRQSGVGAGLGLYIAKGVIEAHGGQLWAESTPGATTRFHLTLPIAAPVEVAPGAARAHAPA